MTNLISKDTGITLGLVATVIVGVAAGVAAYYDTKNSQRAILDEMRSLREAVDIAASDRYTKTAASEVASRNALLNPRQIVVDPRDPDKVMPNAAGIEYMRGVGVIRE